MWQEKVKPAVAAGKLAVIGVVQEQHPDRAKLYQQWRQLDWPIAVDALNLLDYEVVPIPIAIDEHGVVRKAKLRNPEELDAFLKTAFPAPEGPALALKAPEWNPNGLHVEAMDASTAESWRAAGDAYFLTSSSNKSHLGLAIRAYELCLDKDPSDARARFRLGVASRRRHETDQRQPGDAQRAVEQWELALAARPSQYIWRRRIQQFGPTLTKPYNFYQWVEEARAAITARDETPVPLTCEPRGSEILGRPTAVNRSRPLNPDPKSKVPQDDNTLIKIETVVTPPRVRPGGRVRVRVHLSPDLEKKPYWNNESNPLVVALGSHPALKVIESAAPVPGGPKSETRETRILEFEVEVDADRKPGTFEVPAYAVYSVCEDAAGVCRYLRQDLIIQFHVDPAAAKID